MTSFSYSLGQVLSPERKKFHSCVIKCSPLSILPETFSHDVLLISEEKKIIHCHKCVLVARSGITDLLIYFYNLYTEYFQSMLLMGWREVLEYIPWQLYFFSYTSQATVIQLSG